MNILIRITIQFKLQKIAVIFLILCGAFFINTSAFGQSLAHGNNLVTLQAIQEDSQLDDSALSHLNSLLQEVQTAIYLDDSGHKVYGAHPVCVYTDLLNFKAIKSLVDINHVELVTVRIYPTSDLGDQIDIELLSDFPKLRYVYILSTADLPQNTLKKIIKNYKDSGIIVFYNIVKDS